MDVFFESKSLPSVGYSRKSYLQITSQRLIRDKLVHLNGQRSLALVIKILSKTPKLNTIWLETITRVLNMPIELKGNNYYSKVFKRVNYKLQNSTFWVVIIYLFSNSKEIMLLKALSCKINYESLKKIKNLIN